MLNLTKWFEKYRVPDIGKTINKKPPSLEALNTLRECPYIVLVSEAEGAY
jgi:hypothetical protein